MRREFILMLLGIICMSTISSFLSGYVQINTNRVLLDTVVGAVGAGNFSYWQLGHTGAIIVELTSLTGDADLYVSDTIKPSYEWDKNNFSSTTCGPDIVSIPPNFPRPIGIGVFGHWSSFLSEYSIHVYLDISSSQQHVHMQLFQHGQAEERNVAMDFGYKDVGRNNASLMSTLFTEVAITKIAENVDKISKEKPPRKPEDQNKPRYLKLINILDMIFEMFVL